MASLEQRHRLFKALADPTRLRILNLLEGGELCVCRLFEILQLPQSTVSRHLAYLKRAGLVENRKVGTWSHYRLSEPVSELHRRLMACVRDCLGELPGMSKDLKRKTACCK